MFFVEKHIYTKLYSQQQTCKDQLGKKEQKSILHLQDFGFFFQPHVFSILLEIFQCRWISLPLYISYKPYTQGSTCTVSRAAIVCLKSFGRSSAHFRLGFQFNVFSLFFFCQNGCFKTRETNLIHFLFHSWRKMDPCLSSEITIK